LFGLLVRNGIASLLRSRGARTTADYPRKWRRKFYVTLRW
jgi:hypothetical protein